MTEQEASRLFHTNIDFEQYVEAFCRSKHITTDQALKHKMVQNVGQFYQERAGKNGKQEIHKSNENACGT